MPDVLENFYNTGNPFEDEEIIQSLSLEDQQMFLSEREIIEIEKGDEIINEGQVPKGVYYVQEGTAKLYKIGFNGKEQILRFAKKGDMIGYRSILEKQPFGASAKALKPMKLLFVPEVYFLKIIEANPKLALEMLQIMAHELGEAGKTITLLAQKTVRERLAEILLLLEKKLGTDRDGYINISLTREEMANLIGTATESAIRLISEFRTDELISVDGRRIKVLDHHKLTKLGHVVL